MSTEGVNYVKAIHTCMYTYEQQLMGTEGVNETLSKQCMYACIHEDLYCILKSEFKGVHVNH